MKSITQLNGEDYKYALFNIGSKLSFKADAEMEALEDVKNVITSPFSFVVFHNVAITRIIIQAFAESTGDKAEILERAGIAGEHIDAIINDIEYIMIFAQSNDNKPIVKVQILAYRDCQKEQTLIEQYVEKLLYEAEKTFKGDMEEFYRESNMIDYAVRNRYVFSDTGELA